MGDFLNVFTDQLGRNWVKKGSIFRCIPENDPLPDGYVLIFGRVIVNVIGCVRAQYGEITWYDNEKIRVQLDDGSEIEFSRDTSISLDGRFSFYFFWPDDGDASEEDPDDGDTSEEDSDDEGQV